MDTELVFAGHIEHIHGTVEAVDYTLDVAENTEYFLELDTEDTEDSPEQAAGGTEDAETDIVLGTVFDFLEGAGVVSAAADEGL